MKGVIESNNGPNREYILGQVGEVEVSSVRDTSARDSGAPPLTGDRRMSVEGLVSSLHHFNLLALSCVSLT